MSQLIRLPQDVGPAHGGDALGIPDLTKLQGNVDEYVAMRARLDDHQMRALGCWGLVARWSASREAVETLLQSSRTEDIEDAAGILGRVGLPEDMLPRVLSLIEALPDSSARDGLVQSLPLGHPRRAPDAVSAADALQALAHVPLRGDWEPYTSRIQFIEASFEAVSKEFALWMDEIRREYQREYQMSEHRGSLATLLANLDPHWWPSKDLLVEAGNGWTAVFSNGADTYLADYLSRRMGVRGVATTFSVDIVHRGEIWNYGGTIFELLDKGESVRLIQVTRQSSGWDAVLVGTELPFEESVRYQARIKRERFDIEMLNRYCSALGITRSDNAFYGPRALLHTEGAKVPAWKSLLKRPKLHHYPTAAAWRAAHLRPPPEELI